MIYTSYFANMRKLPRTILPVSIALYTPVNLKFRDLPIYHFKELAPTFNILNEYKHRGVIETYVDAYRRDVLGPLDVNEVKYWIDHVGRIRGFTDVALLCYETPEKFCHRHLVAEWFKENGIHCEELKGE